MIKSKNLNSSVVTDGLTNKMNQKRAFSIGEVILSVFILGVTMVTILSLYAKGLREFQDERDSVIASLLAQEGVELARNIRDNNWADRTCALEAGCATFPKTFANFYNSNTYYGSVDVVNDDAVIFNATYTLRLNGGFYVHSGGTAVKFKRRIILDYHPGGSNANNAESVVITSLISWRGGGTSPPFNTTVCNMANKCVFSQETLTDWGTGT